MSIFKSSKTHTKMQCIIFNSVATCDDSHSAQIMDIDILSIWNVPSCSNEIKNKSFSTYLYKNRRTLTRQQTYECRKKGCWKCPYCIKTTKHKYDLKLHVNQQHKVERYNFEIADRQLQSIVAEESDPIMKQNISHQAGIPAHNNFPDRSRISDARPWVLNYDKKTFFPLFVFLLEPHLHNNIDWYIS